MQRQPGTSSRKFPISIIDPGLENHLPSSRDQQVRSRFYLSVARTGIAACIICCRAE
jgi:hypothetical protein